MINSAIHSYQCFYTNIFGYSFLSKFYMCQPWYSFLNQEIYDEKSEKYLFNLGGFDMCGKERVWSRIRDSHKGESIRSSTHHHILYHPSPSPITHHQCDFYFKWFCSEHKGWTSDIESFQNKQDQWATHMMSAWIVEKTWMFSKQGK